MYDISQLLRGLRNPKEVAFEIHNQYHRRIESSGVVVMDRDWDNLVILDACRYDIFEEVNILPGTLESVTSLGSRTSEFLQRNFEHEEFLNTVYVTANPMHEQIDLETPFHEIVPVWQDEWDDEYGTVLPETFTKRVVAVHQEFPNKRVIAHYNQPHVPFIGDSRERIETAKREAEAWATEESFGGFEHVAQLADGNLWQAVSLGLLDTETVYQAYVENLELTIPHVAELNEELNGKTVVTSDHGNAIADRGPFGMRVYGHPYRTYMAETVKVPWLVIESDERRHLIMDESHDHDRIDSEVVEERLANLGYTE